MADLDPTDDQLPAGAAEVLDRAQAAWDDKKLGFVWRAGAATGLDDTGLTEILHRILEIGWDLGGTALAGETVLLTFVAPAEEQEWDEA